MKTAKTPPQPSTPKTRRGSGTMPFLTQEELKRLLAVIANKRDKALFLLGYRHGLRAFGWGFLQTPPHGGRLCPSPNLRLREHLARGLPPRSFCAMPGTHAQAHRRAVQRVRSSKWFGVVQNQNTVLIKYDPTMVIVCPTKPDLCSLAPFNILAWDSRVSDRSHRFPEEHGCKSGSSP
jgi:hypothetical protein